LDVYGKSEKTNHVMWWKMKMLPTDNNYVLPCRLGSLYACAVAIISCSTLDSIFVHYVGGREG